MKYTYLIKSILACTFLANLVYANHNSRALNIEYEIYDNIVVWGCDFYNGKKGIKIEVLSVTGGSNSNYSVSVNGEGFAMPSNSIPKGKGFVYFFTANDISSGNVGFTVSDAQGNNQTMEANLIFILSSLSIPIYCGAPDKCSQGIINHTEDDKIDTDVYQVTNRISSCGTIPERSTSYIAVNEICLNSGFEVKLISNFTAAISQPCSD